MKKNFITKNFLYFNPNLIFELKKEDITNDICDIVAKKSVNMDLDINNYLKSNYYFLLKKIQYDSNIYLYFDKKFLSNKDYYELFFEYFKKWPNNYQVLSQYPDVLVNINLEQLFDKNICRMSLGSYFDDYKVIPDFIKQSNDKLFEMYFASDKCFELYPEFIKNINKKMVDAKMKEKFMGNIDFGLKNHNFIKDFIVNNLISDVQSKEKIYDFILQNSGNLKIEEYDYFLDSNFYKKYYEIYPERFDFSKYKLNNNDIFESSNLMEYWLLQEHVDEKILDYFAEHAYGNLKIRLLDKKRRLSNEKIIDEIIVSLTENRNYIREINADVNICTDLQLFKIAGLMVDYEFPHNIEFLWKNKYYVKHLIDTDKLKDFICLDFFDSYPSDIKIQLFNYFKDKKFNPVKELLINNNYDINTYSCLIDEDVIFSFDYSTNEYRTHRFEILNILSVIKDSGIHNKVRINFSNEILSNDFEFLLECEEILPGQILNLQNDLVISYNSRYEHKILQQLQMIKESNFNKNVIIRPSYIYNNDVLPKEFLEKINALLPGRVIINNKSISDVIEIDRTLDYYVKSVADYYDRNNNLKCLSQYEKYIAIYTIVTNYSRYISENEDERAENSRSIYEIINSKDQKIVCVGFVTLLNVLLNRIGIESIKTEYSDNHCRAIVRIDDDKYNIHTYFICDPTWDCRTNDDLSSSRGTYNYVHLDFYNMSDRFDHLVGDDFYKTTLSEVHRKVTFSKRELEESLSDEKLVVALANIERFVDKNQTMSNGIKLGEDISVEEYNETALKYGRVQTIGEDKFFDTPIYEIFSLNNPSLEKNIISSISCNELLRKYGIELNVNFNYVVSFKSIVSKDDNNPYSKYLENYLTCFNFCNKIALDASSTFNGVEHIIKYYSNLLISGIPSEYCERYREVGTIDIPFGNNEMAKKILEIEPTMELYENVPYDYCLMDLGNFYKSDEVNFIIFNYLFNFNQNIDFDLFSKWITAINPDWRSGYNLLDLKLLATQYVNEREYMNTQNKL